MHNKIFTIAGKVVPYTEGALHGEKYRNRKDQEKYMTDVTQGSPSQHLLHEPTGSCFQAGRPEGTMISNAKINQQGSTDPVEVAYEDGQLSDRAHNYSTRGCAIK